MARGSSGESGGRSGGLGTRWAVWRAGRGPVPQGFVGQPEPRSIGHVSRGKQLMAGNFLLAGHLVEAAGKRPWDIRAPDRAFTAELHGFAWLDDLAAVGDAAARARAQDWTWSWIARFGRGSGPGWAADLTGRRLIRWINHAFFILAGRSRADTDRFFHLLQAQAVYLSRRWRALTPGLPRFEALAGTIVAGLALVGMEGLVGPALAALADDCRRGIDAEGGLPTRNPEELLEVFTLMGWIAAAMTEAGHPLPPDMVAAMDRTAPTLRALRHADGGLARFHGGGRGLDGRLDWALANSGVRGTARAGLAMGFARLSAGRTSVIIDAAPPPTGAAGHRAHASTLAFEMTSGRRPVIVNCGPGAPFGAEWAAAARATPSHSTLAIDGWSSSRVGVRGRGPLVDRAKVLDLKMTQDRAGQHFSALHDGWQVSHGLAYGRILTLDPTGRRLTGTEVLQSQSPAERKAFDRALRNEGVEGIPFTIRFHLHPEVDASLDMGGTAISLALRSGEIWVFRHDGRCSLGLEASVHLENGRLTPRSAQQITLTGWIAAPELRIGWTLAKAQDTPLAIRDDDPQGLPVPL